MSENLAFAGVRLVDADFSRSRLHSANFYRAKITDAWFVEADVSGDITGLRLNGVEVAPLIEAELNRLYPERALLAACTPEEFASAWEMIEGIWEATVARAKSLPGEWLFEQVDGEWSFVETQRHLILATDCWLGRMVKNEPEPFHKWGLAGSFLTEPERIGLEYDARPSLDELLAVRRQHMDAVAATIADLTEAELARICQPPDTINHPNEPASVLHCLRVILDEEWSHCQYANRDLDTLENK
jgi:uncharacterized protein YjbI with pentapeptide repeats